MPSQVTSIVGPNQSFAGVWNFTSSSHPGMWNAPKGDFQPRFGLAYRINDRTALRFGYALYTVPTEYNFTPAPVSGFEDVNFLEPPFFGMTGYQNVAPSLNGIPQETFDDPYPASNPLVPIPGKAAGGNVGRGGSPLLSYPQDFEKAYNNRLNVTFATSVARTTGGVVDLLRKLRKPALQRGVEQYRSAILQQYSPDYLNNTSVANPFYHYRSQTLLPGPLFNQQQVPLCSLLIEVSALRAALRDRRAWRARALPGPRSPKLQKRFSKGYNFLFGYIYIKEKSHRSTISTI